MRPRREEADQELLRRIRQLARANYSRAHIHGQLCDEGYRIKLETVRKIIHRCAIAISPHPRAPMLSDLAAAKAALADEIAAAKANPASMPYKPGALMW